MAEEIDTPGDGQIRAFHNSCRHRGSRICSKPSGQAAKLCNNMILAVQQIAVGEAFVLAEKLGLSDQALYDVVTGATLTANGGQYFT